MGHPPQSRESDASGLLVVEELEHFSELLAILVAGDCGGEEEHELVEADLALALLVEVADHLVERVGECFWPLSLDGCLEVYIEERVPLGEMMPVFPGSKALKMALIYWSWSMLSPGLT